MRKRPSPSSAALTLATASLLAACASAPADKAAADAKAEPAKAAQAAPAAGRAASASAPSRAASGALLSVSGSTSGPPGGPPPFATVIKDARRIDGPLVMWQKDEKVWIELLPSQFGQPFLLSPKIKNGVSESWVLGGLMAASINGAGGVQVVEFVRVHNQVRLQARNTDVMAKAGTPEARAVEASYSNSLLGSLMSVFLNYYSTQMAQFL